MSAELLTILNANGIKIDHVPGGIPSITEQDVLMAMSGSPVGMWRLALVKICGRAEETRSLYHALSVTAASKPSVRSWVMKNKGYLERLCLLAIWEFNLNSRCTPCNGSGMRKNKNKLEKCGFCNATGYKGIGKETRARKLEIKTKRWKQYKNVYADIFNILVGWETGIRRRLQRKLR